VQGKGARREGVLVCADPRTRPLTGNSHDLAWKPAKGETMIRKLILLAALVAATVPVLAQETLPEKAPTTAREGFAAAQRPPNANLTRHQSACRRAL
jgi:hypothetical protein